ncbi:MAG TPA: hypothetical protein PK052_06765 [Anaerohalosphaeraceae bacterium]|nr:hypothetical protein [Phycisphaerae bacterium]HOK96901.1 hypothetical protein [Anaerohalosphaeraceae bacterium]HOL31668.1 hypothetical protein [Anaerohalosphaeraceae bacterium]HOM75383.1 hypothetical protein [Anaerohalosphaeraceae bacterium]HPC64885.1 hypothetical protein [Anaerohalosphaeraceae bacterium]
MTPQEKAQKGLSLLKEAIVEIIESHPNGIRNVDIADLLEIHSDYSGGNKDFLSWSIIGLLLNEGKIERKGKKYYPQKIGVVK